MTTERIQNPESGTQKPILSSWIPDSGFWILLLYFVALVVRRDSVPAGLNNDAAEETLRGLFLIDAGRFEVITAVFGIPQETLYLYAAAASAKLAGTTTLAVQVPCWCIALATVYLLQRLIERVSPAIPAWIGWLVAVSSIWMFHYGRSGIRAASAPFFLLAFVLLLDRSEKNALRDGRAKHGVAAAAGAVLALSIYAYTSCRVLVIAFLLHAAIRLLRSGPFRPRLLRAYATMTVVALAVSIPNLVFLFRTPRDFLLRGGYVLPGGASGAASNLAGSILLPFHYADRYRTIVGPSHVFDGVSAGLTAAGIDPVHPVIALAIVVGVLAAWRRRAEPAVPFLFATLACGTIALGVSGPSLTRFLILLPAYLALAALGLTVVASRWRPARLAILAALLLVSLSAAHDYFSTFARNAEAQRYFSPAATPIGNRARELAIEGHRVVCVVAKDANVVNYLTYDHAADVRVVEFYRRPLDVRAVPLEEFRPQRLLIEHDPRFGQFSSAFPKERRTQLTEFDEIVLE